MGGKVFHTPSERLAYVLEVQNIGKSVLGRKIGVSNSTISAAIKRKKISEKLLAKILKAIPLNPDWLLYGKGEPFGENTLKAVAEPTVIYTANKSTAAERFERVIRHYANHKNLDLKEVAEQMRVAYNDLIKTINGHRTLDCDLLSAAVLHLNADANDIVAGVKHTSAALRESQQRVKDLELLVASQRETIEILKEG